MGKKKQRSKGKVPAVARERIEALRALLGDLGPGDCTDDELITLIEVCLDQPPADALRDLERLTEAVGESKARVKALKRAAYRLGQRGIDTSTLAVGESRGGIRVVPDSGPGGGLPVLLAPIETNAERTLMFCVPRGPTIVVVEVVFKARELFRLVAQVTHRQAYRRFANQLCETIREDSLPERVRAPAGWLRRKLWEIGRFQKSGDLGKEVDQELLDFLEIPSAKPIHPAHDLDLSEARVLGMEEMAARPYRIAPIFHGSAMAALRQQWYEHGGSELIEVGAAAGAELREDMERAVSDWANQWGLDRAAEVLLDAALFFGVQGDRDAARTYLEPVATDDLHARDARIRAFLLEFAMSQIGR